ncbi:MAG TPA: carboxypeptidase M32 [bacterium]|nr:carboxypeptidase M32 [bacterium]
MAVTPQAALQELNQKTRAIYMLNSCASLLGWDERTYMPHGGVKHRAEQLAMLAGMTHERTIDPKIGELLDILRSSGSTNGGTGDAEVIVREVGRFYERATKMPQALVEELSRTASLAQAAWEEARAKKDFKIFKPWLAKMIDLKKQEAMAVGYKDDPYNALLDDYEPGATVKDIEKTLNDLRVELVKLLDKIQGSSRRPKSDILHRRFPREMQEKFGREASDRIGFDYKRGRLDVTVHPFCTGIGPGDTRLTTRYDEHDFANAFFGTLHESGHGIYDQGLPEDHFGTPLGDSISLGIHESQSRMWENQVGRSRAFWTFFYPKAQQYFAEALADVSLDDFYFAINDVKPSFIRTESDEGTYNLHILIRFELERAFFAGQLTVDDVPAAWNQKYREYLGITPPDDAIGCMQDVHWSAGLIGYFPTYSLGNLYAAQFFAQAKKDLGDLDADFAKGEFGRLKKWLNDKIHAHGRRYLAADLVKKVTGKPLSHEALMSYMNAKFGALYGF